MKLSNLSIRTKINVALLVEAVFIGGICIFIFVSFKVISSKLHFIEVFDDINITFLKMRKEEKNYFLYKDYNALIEAYKEGENGYKILTSLKDKLISSLGFSVYNRLTQTLKQYLGIINELRKNASYGSNPELESKLRGLGHILTTFSVNLIKREHKKVNKIIHRNTVMLIFSLTAILFSQLILWQFFFRFFLEKLAKMEELTRAVVKRHFHEVGIKPLEKGDEISLVMNAISKMAQELEKREEQILQAQKLASLGMLISGVAHELGNPLNNITMLVESVLGYYDSIPDEEKKQYLKEIDVQADRIKKIIQNLLDFARSQKPEFKECQPKEVVEKSIALVENQLHVSGIKLHKNFAPNLPSIYVDANQIQQVLVNLFTNAIQAMPNGGDLFIDVYPDESKGKIIIKIKDTGTGIKPEVLPHIFDPFFTTKGTKGTGLGLSVSYGIIKQHNGKISVHTEVGKGTTFIIELPIYRSNN